MPLPAEIRVERHARRWRMALGFLALLVAAFFLPPGASAFAIVTALLGLVSASARPKGWQDAGSAAVRVTPAGLVLQTGAEEVELGGATTVVLAAGAPELEAESAGGERWRLRASSHEEALALVEAMGTRARIRLWEGKLGTSDFPVAVALLSLPLWFLPFAPWFTPATAAALALPLWALAVSYAARWHGPARVVIGLDGIRARRGPFVSFHPWAAVRDFSVTRDGVTLFGRDGSRVRLAGRNLEGERLEEVRRHLEQAWFAHERAERPQLPVLSRGGAPVGEWLGGLRGLVARGGYRSASAERAALVALLGGPSASAEQRIGAAIALGLDDPEVKRKLRVAASGAADPRVRVALDALVEGQVDEAAIEEALAADARS